MKTFMGFAAAVAVAMSLTATTADAAVLYASQVDSATKGTVLPPAQPGRDDPNAALGAGDGVFYSMGLGGEAVFSFGMPAGAEFGSPGTIIEVTRGIRDNHIETIDLYGVNGLIETFIGTVVNSVASNIFLFAGTFTQLKLVDTSPAGGGSTDGFDIDAISVTPAPIPLPAGGLLLLSGLAGVAALRRRKSV
jgi:hypothetical protein